MEFLRMKFEQVRRMLGALSTSQKLVGWLAAILVAVSLVWLLQAAAKPEMVNVFNTPLAVDEMVAAEQALNSSGMNVEVIDGLLKVPADQKNRAWTILATQQIMAPEGSTDLEELLLAPSMWRTSEDSNRLWSHHRQSKLSSLISAFDGVKRAVVVVQEGQRRELGARAIPATASVTVWMERGKTISSGAQRGMADLIKTAAPGLKRSDISIVDATNKKTFKVSEDGEGNGDALDDVRQWDSMLEEKISKVLENIPDLIVSVSTVLDPTKSVTVEERNYLDPVSGKVESSNEMMTGAGRAATEPGVVANTNGAARLPAGGAGGGSSEATVTASALRFPETFTRREEGHGTIKEKSASVVVPMAFLVHAYQKRNGVDSPPGDADIQAHLDRIRERVKNAAHITDDRLVSVDWYIAAPPAPTVEPAQAGVVGTLTVHGKPVALGTLAAAALVMVMVFAKRRLPDPPIMETSFDAEFSPDATVGAVEGGEGALEGIELDEDSIRTQRVVEQVSEMVRERPDSATNLLRRWIEQG